MRAAAAARDKDQVVFRCAQGAHARGRSPTTTPTPHSRTGHARRCAPNTPPPVYQHRGNPYGTSAFMTAPAAPPDKNQVPPRRTPVRDVRVHAGRGGGARASQLRLAAAHPPVDQHHPNPYGSCAFKPAAAAARDQDQEVSRRARGAHARYRSPATPPRPQSRTGHVRRRAPTTPPPPPNLLLNKGAEPRGRPRATSPTPTKPVRDKRAQKASEK